MEYGEPIEENLLDLGTATGIFVSVTSSVYMEKIVLATSENKTISEYKRVQVHSGTPSSNS